MADMVGGHFRLQLLAGDLPGVDQVGEHRIDQRLLPRVGVDFVVAASPAAEEVERTALAQRVIDRQAGLPGLRAPLGRVEDAWSRGVRRSKSFHSGSRKPMVERSSRFSSIQST